VSLRVISHVGSGLVVLGLIAPAFGLAWLTRWYARRRRGDVEPVQPD
jgi:hypothetical protein